MDGKKRHKNKAPMDLEDTDTDPNNPLEMITACSRRETKKLKLCKVNESNSRTINQSLNETISASELMLSIASEVKDNVVEHHCNKDSENSDRKKKAKSKLQDSRGGKAGLVLSKLPSQSSYANCKIKQEDKAAAIKCIDPDNQHLKKKSKKKNQRQVKLEVEEVNVGSMVSEELPSLSNTSSPSCEGVVDNLMALAYQRYGPTKRQMHISEDEAFNEEKDFTSEVLLQNIENTTKNINVCENLEDPSFAYDFAGMLECEAVLGSTSNESDEENEIIPLKRIKNKRFKCKICHRSYTRRDNLEVHLRTHSSERRFCCNECKSSFNFKHVLREHILTMHSSQVSGQEIISFSCSVCEYSAKRKQDLEKHKNSVHSKHFGQIYPCKLCSSIFTDSSNLRKHNVIVHLKPADYVCYICGKTFHQADNLKKHMKIHGDKIHCCPVCNQEFKSLHCFTMHLATHLPKVGFNCPFCEYVLASESDERLKRHIREKHRYQEYR